MNTQTLSAEVRTGGGKGPSRQLRMRGLIPAVFYGPEVEPQSISVSPKELVKALSTQFARNVVIEVDVAGKKELAMVREVQVHPLTREALHVDLYRVMADRPVEVKVPFRTEGKAVGVQKGGAINLNFRDLPVRAKPMDIPAEIVADVTNLDIGDAVTTKDLVLAEGVTVVLKAERRLATCDEFSKLVMEEEAADATAAVPGAPAAGAAAPAAAAAADKKPADKK
ncbi:MAG: 50S ribosomal protein L25 [Polyangiales bacterium]|nr:50S ribosomal protein L25 [Myxococcales bacterium]